MYKIRLLILLLSSIFFFSCSTSKFDQKKKLNVGYIGGEYDGLLLSNQLMAYLSNFNLYDKKSIYQIEGKIKHSSNLFITNIDNTSDRMRVDTEITIEIINQKFKCVTHKFEESISQYYIFADSDKYISNNNAEKKIREYNTEALVKEFINKLKKPKAICKKLNE